MRVTIIRPVSAGASGSFAPGDAPDLPDSVALHLIGLRKAIHCVAHRAPAAAAAVETAEAIPAVETTDAAPAASGKRTRRK